MKNTITHIAIVGCGFSGTSALHQLVNSYPVREVTIFEATGNFGPGFPYAPDEHEDYLINNTTDTMCLAPDNRRAFLDWLEKQNDIDVDLYPKGHLPRRTYGVFLEHAFADACALAKKTGIKINKIASEVLDVAETDDGQVSLRWRNGKTTADAAIMTTGRCPDKEIMAPPPDQASATYIHNHISCDELDTLPLDGDIHVLGASLSAYDIVNRLYSETTGCRFERGTDGDLVFRPGYNDLRVILCSRSGRLKKMQSRAPQKIERSGFTRENLSRERSGGHVALSTIAEVILTEAADHHAAVDHAAIIEPYNACETIEDVNARAQEIIAKDINAAKNGNGANFLVDLLDDAQIELWDGFADQLLSPEDERLYRRDIETAMLTFSAPCPIPTAERLLALHRAGRLKLITGVASPELSSDETHYTLTHAFGEERASILINATGKVDRDVQSEDQPQWIRSMVSNGSLRAYKRGGNKMPGADIDMDSFRPRGSRNIYFANMLLWGPGLFTSSAILMATIVSRTLEVIFKNE